MTKEKNANSILPDEVITSKIYLIRGEKIMIDRDLADLFDVKAIRLREQVKRNIEKFPIHFMFQLTNEEVTIMVTQNAIPSKQHLGGTLPYVFSEYGILQLANILKSGRATQMSITIIEQFIKMREILSTHKKILDRFEYLEAKDIDQDKKIKLIFDYLKQFEKTKKKELEYQNRHKIAYKISTEK